MLYVLCYYIILLAFLHDHRSPLVGNSSNKMGFFVAIDFIYADGNHGLNGLTMKICEHFFVRLYTHKRIILTVYIYIATSIHHSPANNLQVCRVRF